MQPIIDVIFKLCKDYIDDYFAAHPPGGGFVDRGDPSSFDWDKNDLTTDWTWRDLDCSAIVPENAVAILFYMQLSSVLVPRDLQLRKKGNVNNHNRSNIKAGVSNTVVSGDFVCPCDVNRFVQYRATAGVFVSIVIGVRGWWL